MLGVGRWPFVDDWARAASESTEVIGLQLPEKSGQNGIDSGSHDSFTTLAVPVQRLRPSRVFWASNSKAESRAIVAAVGQVEDQIGKVDILHSHFYSASGGVPRACSALGIPFVHTEHSSWLLSADPNKSISRVGVKTLRRVTEGAARVLFVSNGLLEAARGQGARGQFEVLENPVDERLFAPGGHSGGDALDLVTVGGLVPGKRHSLLIEAFSVSRLPASSRLHIVGDGPLRETLMDKAGRLGLAQSIVFHGNVSRSEVAQVLRSVDLYVHTSMAETFGVAIVEALLTGLQVVSTPCRGVLDSMPSDLPVYVTPGTPEDIARTIESAFARPTDLSRHEISQMARSRFASSVVANRLGQIYREAITSA